MFYIIFSVQVEKIVNKVKKDCLWKQRTHKNSAEGVIAPAGAKVTGATIRMWLLNKFISFLAVLTWKTGLKNVDKVPSGAHIFQASPIPSNGYIFSTDFSYHTAQ